MPQESAFVPLLLTLQDIPYGDFTHKLIPTLSRERIIGVRLPALRKVAKDLTKRVQDKAIGQNVLTSLTPGQLMTKIVHDELVELMGGTQEGINLADKPSIILIAGLQGSGKTTFSGKLANFLKKKKNKKLLLRRKISTKERYPLSKKA